MIYTVKNNKLLIMFRTSLTSSYCSGKISPDSSGSIKKFCNVAAYGRRLIIDQYKKKKV